MRLGHVDFYLRTLIFGSVCLFAFVTIRPPSLSSYNDSSSRNNILLFEANINNNNNQIDNEAEEAKLNDSAAMALLTSSMRILCICQTTGPRHQERAVHVKTTWGKRCTKLVFASDEDDDALPAYKFSPWAGRQYVTFKMRGALLWAHEHELNNFDWFLKADDDSFIIMENLRAFLSSYSPNGDHYFGRHFAVAGSVIGENFVSGAAYVLSRSTLRRYVAEAIPNTTKCPLPSTDAHEDVNLGYCLANIGIIPGDTRDQLGRHRFLVFSAWVHLMTGSADKNNWIRKYDKYEYKEGEQCCSDTAILLHYVPGGYMLAIEYFLYRLRPIGFDHYAVKLPAANEAAWKSLLIKRDYKIGSAKFQAKKKLPMKPQQLPVSTMATTTTTTSDSRLKLMTTLARRNSTFFIVR